MLFVLFYICPFSVCLVFLYPTGVVSWFMLMIAGSGRQKHHVHGEQMFSFFFHVLFDFFGIRLITACCVCVCVFVLVCECLRKCMRPMAMDSGIHSCMVRSLLVYCLLFIVCSLPPGLCSPLPAPCSMLWTLWGIATRARKQFFKLLNFHACCLYLRPFYILNLYEYFPPALYLLFPADSVKTLLRLLTMRRLSDPPNPAKFLLTLLTLRIFYWPC
jgi:hypothetical protein